MEQIKSTREQLRLSKRLLDEMVTRVRRLTEQVNASAPWDPPANEAVRERGRLWEVVEFAAQEVRRNYGLVYVPPTFEGHSYFYHKDTFIRWAPEGSEAQVPAERRSLALN